MYGRIVTIVNTISIRIPVQIYSYSSMTLDDFTISTHPNVENCTRALGSVLAARLFNIGRINHTYTPQMVLHALNPPSGKDTGSEVALRPSSTLESGSLFSWWGSSGHSVSTEDGACMAQLIVPWTFDGFIPALRFINPAR